MFNHGPYGAIVIALGRGGATAAEFDARIVERQRLDLGSAQVDSDTHGMTRVRNN